MITFGDVRQRFQECTASHASAGAGRQHFVNSIRYGLGLCDENGRNHHDRFGNRVVRVQESTMDPRLFSFPMLASAMIGPEWQTYFNPDNKYSLLGLGNFNSHVMMQHGDDRQALLEATGAGVDPGNFANINAWTGVVAGLIERRILEAFQNPEFIADRLLPVEPTKVAEGQKIFTVSRIGDLGEERQPGERHRRAGFGERYVTLQKTRENALACDVTKEAVFFDLTGQVLAEADSVGDWIAYRKEIDVIDAFIGVTTTSTGKYKWTYKGTSYNFYTTSTTFTTNTGASITFTNQQSNQLLDWTALQNSWLLFVRMLDPETGTRINVRPDCLLVNPANLATAKMIINSQNVERREAAAATQATAVTLQITNTQNPAKDFGTEEVIWSPLVEQRCTDATGLALGQTDTNNRWWHFKRGAMKYFQNYPMNLQAAPPNSYEMLDRGIIHSVFANERGMPGAVYPWWAVMNTT